MRTYDVMGTALGSHHLMTERRRILFLCTGNACRSPMAEGWLGRLSPERHESLSAGSDPAGWVHPLAVKVMAEVKIDISAHRSKSIWEFLRPYGSLPHVLVALCDYALSRCPGFPPTVSRLYWPVLDPIAARGDEEERLCAFRAVRDEIRSRIERALAETQFDRPPQALQEASEASKDGGGPSGRHPLHGDHLSPLDKEEFF